MRRPICDETYRFAVRHGEKRFWYSVHRYLSDADKTVEDCERRWPHKTFEVWEYHPTIKTAFPARGPYAYGKSRV